VPSTKSLVRDTAHISCLLVGWITLLLNQCKQHSTASITLLPYSLQPSSCLLVLQHLAYACSPCSCIKADSPPVLMLMCLVLVLHCQAPCFLRLQCGSLTRRLSWTRLAGVYSS